MIKLNNIILTFFIINLIIFYIDIIKSLIEDCDKIIIDTEQKVKISVMKDDPNKLYYINISK